MKARNGSRRLVKLGAVLALALLVLGAAVRLETAPTASAATTTVQVGQKSDSSPGNEFNVASITAATGDTIHWNWFDNFHNVTWVVLPPTAAPANSATSGPPLTFDQILTVAGTYTYRCTLHSAAADASLANVDTNITNHSSMVGKIVVSAPAPDLTPPAVSAVVATPNPTDGAGSVALTASVADSGTPLGTIASARYRIDGGASVAMAATDGLFNASSEGVSANVPVGALSLGIHTLEVQGTDNAGLLSAWVALSGGLNVTAPPAGAVQATVAVNAGNLTNTAQNIVFPAVTLDGTDQLKAGATTAWLAKDARGSGAGWNVTISSGNFTSTSGSIPVANFKCQLLQASIATIFGNTAPTTAIGTFVPLSGTPTKLLSAAVNAGMGQYSYTPDFQLTVPGSTPAGSYTANVSVSVNSGP